MLEFSAQSNVEHISTDFLVFFVLAKIRGFWIVELLIDCSGLVFITHKLIWCFLLNLGAPISQRNCEASAWELPLFCKLFKLKLNLSIYFVLLNPGASVLRDGELGGSREFSAGF